MKSLSVRFETRTATTSLLGTRAFFGSIRSFHDHTKPLTFGPLRTPKAKPLSSSDAPGKESAIRRTSFWVAMRDNMRLSGETNQSAAGFFDRDTPRNGR